MSLKDQGFVFVCRNGRFDWYPLAEPGEVDCADLGDEAFERMVKAVAELECLSCPRRKYEAETCAHSVPAHHFCGRC